MLDFNASENSERTENPERTEGTESSAGDYSATLRSRSALLMTETELKVMAALAKMGLSSRPKTG